MADGGWTDGTLDASGGQTCHVGCVQRRSMDDDVDAAWATLSEIRRPSLDLRLSTAASSSHLTSSHHTSLSLSQSTFGGQWRQRACEGRSVTHWKNCVDHVFRYAVLDI